MSKTTRTMKSYLEYATKFSEYSIMFMNRMVDEYEDGELTKDEVRDFLNDYIVNLLKKVEGTNARFMGAFGDVVMDIIEENYTMDEG